MNKFNHLNKLIEAKIMYTDLVEVRKNLPTLDKIFDNSEQILKILNDLGKTKLSDDSPSFLGMLNIVDINFSMSEIIFLKHGITTVANVFDFEKTIKSLYANHPDLNELYKDEQKHFELAKYIRNKFISHIQDEVISEAIAWNPVLKFQIEDQHTMKSFYNIWILEALLNTYIYPDGKNKYLKKELNLIYLSDKIDFMIILFDILNGALLFLKKAISILEQYIPKECKKTENISLEEKVLLEAVKSKLASIFCVPEDHEIMKRLMKGMRFSTEESKAYEDANNIIFKTLPTKGR